MKEIYGEKLNLINVMQAILQDMKKGWEWERKGNKLYRKAGEIEIYDQSTLVSFGVWVESNAEKINENTYSILIREEEGYKQYLHLKVARNKVYLYEVLEIQ